VNDYHYKFNDLRVDYLISNNGKIIKEGSINCTIEENTIKEIGWIETQFDARHVGNKILIDLQLLKENNLLSRNTYQFNIEEVR
ncbi:hypothetical protein J7M02_05705, partial [Candidatus Aerophobetes bacterium]|nr:hypothetical protein [Candidatus Aerophobetes bacterium]